MKKQLVIVTGISSDIQFKGMKHVYVGFNHLRGERQYKLVNKDTGKDIIEYVK